MITDIIKNDINVFYINEMDGSFITAIDNFIKNKTNIKKYDWTAQTLRPGMYFGSTNDIISNDMDKILNIIDLEPDKWDFGKDNGDLTKLESIEYYTKKYKKINLITINNTLTTKYCNTCNINLDESIFLLKQLFSQINLMLKLLQKNGNAIFYLKINSLKYSSIVSLLTFITTKFYKVLLYKTNQNIFNDIFYVICIKYNKPISNKEFDIIYNFTQDFDPFKEIIQLKKVNDTLKYNIMFAINEIIENYVFNINRILSFTENYKIFTEKEKRKIFKMLYKYNEEWIHEFKFPLIK